MISLDWVFEAFLSKSACCGISGRVGESWELSQLRYVRLAVKKFNFKSCGTNINTVDKMANNGGLNVTVVVGIIH